MRLSTIAGVTSAGRVPLVVQYLVVAGGGGGHNALFVGGAGAGGYRNSYASETSGGGAGTETPLVLNVATNYTVTVGAGGVGAAELRLVVHVDAATPAGAFPGPSTAPWRSLVRLEFSGPVDGLPLLSAETQAATPRSPCRWFRA